MDIAKYTAYFHDGSLVDIVQKGKVIEFSLMSAELPEGVYCEIPMSRDRYIRGMLVVSEVKKISIDGKPIYGPLKMEYDEGEVFDFEIKGHVLTLTIIWSNCRPKRVEMPTFTIEVEANKMEWIPMIDLINPMERKEPPPGYSGHRVGPHYHALNPNATDWHNKYLDKNKSPVSQGSKASRLKPPERYTGNAFPADDFPLVDGPIIFIKYAGYFHDGLLIGVKQELGRISFKLISAEINEQDRLGDIQLSKDFRLELIIIVAGIEDITVDGKPLIGTLEMKSEIADIYNLEISEHELEMILTWETYTPTFKDVSWSTIKIKFDKLCWENDPLRNEFTAH